MQKDIQTSKGQEKSDIRSTVEKVGEASGHKLKQVGHDINAGLKENVGVGVGNHSSVQDRVESKKHEIQYEKKKEELKEEKKERDQKSFEETGMVGHKLQELGHTVNATLKQNVGIGIGNYSSEVDRERAEEHKEKYEEKYEENKKKLEEKKEEVKQKLEETKEDAKDKLSPNDKCTTSQGETGLYKHRFEEIGHIVNAKLKETVGLGIGDYSSEVDRKKAEEHHEGYMEKVKEESNTEVVDSKPIVHKIKEVAHTVNANLKELIGVGVGNYSSEVDRELVEIHHKKYEEKIQINNTNLDQPSSNQNFNKEKECSDKDDKEWEKDKKEWSNKNNEKPEKFQEPESNKKSSTTNDQKI